MNNFIEQCFEGVQYLPDTPLDIGQAIQQISKNLHIHTYNFYHSELNNLAGQWNIFLNIFNPKEKIWQDFGYLVGQYYAHIYLPQHRRIKQDVNLTQFMHHFCIPSFFLEKTQLSSTNLTENINKVAKIFCVDTNIAKKRLINAS